MKPSRLREVKIKTTSRCQKFYLFWNSIVQVHYNLKLDIPIFSLNISEFTWRMHDLIADVFRYTGNTGRLVPYFMFCIKEDKISCAHLGKNDKLKCHVY